MKKGYLVLADGTVFEGERIGADGNSIGELVFTTGMEGYLETLTDPSFYGQIVVQTFPLIGNYGVISADFEGKTAVRGYIVSELCDTPSNFRSEYELDKFLKDNNIVGLKGLDTRAVTRIIRENGVLNAGIFDSVPQDLSAVKNYAVVNAVQSVSTNETYTVKPSGKVKFKVALVDYGAKGNIIKSLVKRGAEVKVFPSTVKAEEIFTYKPDGVMLSNGPGDPQENAKAIAEIKKIIGKIPVFGICLGHQLVALAMGGATYKLKYGHRGANQPVKSLTGKRTYITSQNHGYAVDVKSLEGVAREIFINANDKSNEGLIYDGKKCFTVQFHPEAAAGPLDTGFLFDKFIDLMKGKEYAEN
ncbi:MAG: glutamine-hydrolyzing carbamoyl-phosphate synthase small subunit [Clostridia bacterium]|nr:glutamine-hydrolyzing carbamoyl-phosphate synthase small subunit [Clostridia bacterium]